MSDWLTIWLRLRFPDDDELHEIIGYSEKFSDDDESESEEDEDDDDKIVSKSTNEDVKNAHLSVEERNMINLTKKNTNFNAHAQNLLPGGNLREDGEAIYQSATEIVL